MGTALLRAEFTRGLRSHLAYPVQAASELVVLVLMAALASRLPAGLMAGVSPVSALDRGGRGVELVMAFVALIGLQVAHRVAREESDLGTLEQLCLAPVGLPVLIAVRCLADTLRMAPLALVALGMSVSPLGFVPGMAMTAAIAILMNVGMLGMGFAIGALTLVVKRTGFIPNLASLALLPIALSPPEAMPVVMRRATSLVPFTHAVRSLQAVIGGDPLSTWCGSLASLCASGAIWLLVGVGVFVAAERLARDRGLLGKY